MDHDEAEFHRDRLEDLLESLVAILSSPITVEVVSNNVPTTIILNFGTPQAN